MEGDGRRPVLNDGLRWKQDVWKSYKQEQNWATSPSVEETERDLFVATAPLIQTMELETQRRSQVHLGRPTVEGGRYRLKHWDLSMWKTILRIQRSSRDRIRYVISAKLEVSKRGFPASKLCREPGHELQRTAAFRREYMPQPCPLLDFPTIDGCVDDLEATGRVRGRHSCPSNEK